MNYKASAFLLLSTVFAFSTQAQTFTVPLYDVGPGQTLNLDNMGTSTINFQEVTNTITIGGFDFTYTTLEKINSSQDWIVTSGGIVDYQRNQTVMGSPASGGVIYNEGIVNINNVVFRDNINTSSLSTNLYGGVIHNTAGGIINSNEPLVANFINNALISNAYAWGGAISNYNNGNIGNINSNFINNYASASASSYGHAEGGAIYNSWMSTIGNITGNFINNYASSSSNAYGGAIYNADASIGNITGNFINNYTYAPQNSAHGGAIDNGSGFGFYTNSIGNITGNFTNNYVLIDGGGAGFGGAINNGGSIGNITGNFINNYVSSGGTTWGYAMGGAIFSGKTGMGSGGISIGDISGSFINNYAQTTSTGSLALGGAIFTEESLTFKANGQDNFFSGNYTQDPTRGKIANAIFVNTDPWSATKQLTFDVTNNGNFIIDDNIEAGQSNWGSTIDYSTQADLHLTGDGTGKVFIRNDLVNIGEINVNDTMLIFAQGAYGKGRFIPDGSLIAPMSGNNSVTSLSLTNGQFYLYNRYFDTVNLVNYTSAGNSFLHLDVGKDGGVWTSDLLNISGDILGQTQVVVYALTSDIDLTSVVFVDAPNDTIENRHAFEVFRTYGSPFVWEAHRNLLGTETGSVWYLTMNLGEENEFTTLPDPITPSEPPELPGQPDPDPEPEIEVNPEVMAYRGLQIAALEQTRSMVHNIRNKVAANKILPDPCANVIDEYMGNNVWVNPIYFNSTTKRPVEVDANIWGLEAGFDVQRDINHKLGIFVSYRKGDYDLSGKGKVYYSDIGSTIDIDSYIAGLYYRYDYRHLWTFATLYGGIQQADIKTKDGVKADTDGTQFGGSVEVGYTGAIKQDLTIEPSLGIFYTQVAFDNINDDFGKTARYGTISQFELEAGVKLEQQLNLANGTAKAYIKPSIVQVMTSGDNVTITGMGKISTYNDGTLGRMEIGGRYAITNQLSTYGFANYTFGSNYDATSLGIGLNYAW